MKGKNELSEFLDEIDDALDAAIKEHGNHVGAYDSQRASGIEEARNIILKMRLARDKPYLKKFNHADIEE